MASTVRSRARRVLREAARDIADGTYPYELYVAQDEEYVPDASEEDVYHDRLPWVGEPYIWVDGSAQEVHLAVRWRARPGSVYAADLSGQDDGADFGDVQLEAVGGVSRSVRARAARALRDLMEQGRVQPGACDLDMDRLRVVCGGGARA